MTDKTPQENNVFEDVKDEVVGIAKGGVKHPATKPVLTGADVGAVAGAVLAVVTWPVGLLAGVGIAFGTGVAFLSTRFLSAMLYGISATDAMSFLGGTSVLLVVAVVATLVPARAALKVSPTQALRYQ